MNSKPMLLMLLMCAALFTSPHVSAQPYPSKPIRIIVPYPPGGGADLVGRVVGLQLSEMYGQQVVIENRAGAQGNIGVVAVAKAPADGYAMLLFDAGVVTMNPWLYANVGFDPIKDFQYISLLAVQPILAVVNPGVPAKNLKELAALARAKPDLISFASGSGTGHLAGEFFKLLARVKMLHVPYKGGAPAAVDLAGGHVDLMFTAAPSAVPLVKAGKLRAIAVTGSTRLPALPDVLTSKESGFPDFEISGWNGLSVPANTPRDVIAKLNKDVANAIRMPAATDRLVSAGLEPKTGSPEEMTNMVKSELERWGKVVKAAGIKPQ